MKISVILSTYNSPAWLEKVLWGYGAQHDSGFEVVVADDGSNEDTRRMIAGFAKRAPFPLRHVWQEDRGFRKWTIVNRAILKASGEYLVFSDGDCVPRANVVAIHRARALPGRYLSGSYCRLPMAASKELTREDIVSQRAFSAIWLARHGAWAPHLIAKAAARPLRLDGLANRLLPARGTFNGNNSSCFKVDALRLGGFDERIAYGGGDREFGYRLAHAGITPRLIRYSALMLHLDHPRGYKDAAIRAANEAIIAETRATRRTRTDHGIRD
jgi:glycosyltransferase involved in cell wall biosynthesis